MLSDLSYNQVTVSGLRDLHAQRVRVCKGNVRTPGLCEWAAQYKELYEVIN